MVCARVQVLTFERLVKCILLAVTKVPTTPGDKLPHFINMWPLPSQEQAFNIPLLLEKILAVNPQPGPLRLLIGGTQFT